MSETANPHLDRRTFLGGLAAGGALVALGDHAAASRAVSAAGRRAVPLARGGKFAQGVACGHPRERGITLWTRLDEIERTSRLRLEVARDPGFSKLVHSDLVRASSVRDFTAHARVSGLKPGERYWYRFETKGAESPVGRFRTLRPPDSRVPVRIGFFSCQDWQSGYYTAHEGLAAEDDLDLVVCLGDYIYEHNYFRGPRTDHTGLNADGDAQTLAEYRAKYRLYRSDSKLQAMHAVHPMLAIWDDHEVGNNWAGDDPDTRADARVPWAERRRNAFLAFFENMPQQRIRTDRNRIYRRIGLGANAELFLLDERSYRDAQPCGDPLVMPPGCTEVDDPRNFLGPAQKEWLKRGLEASRARWKLVGSQMMAMSVDLAPGYHAFNDGWDGYDAERRELIGLIRSKGIRNVAFLTGDVHQFFAGQVTESGRQPGEAAATEFVGGSISALTIPESLSQQPQGDPGLRHALDTFETQNPHFAYMELESYGYGIAEARDDELLVTFRSPLTTKEPESELRTLQRFRVAAGTPRVEVLGA